MRRKVDRNQLIGVGKSLHISRASSDFLVAQMTKILTKTTGIFVVWINMTSVV